MSHIVSIEVQVKDLEALDRACKRLGYVLHRGRANRWFGSWQDDSPVPRHLFSTEDEYQAVQSMTQQQRTAFMQELLNSAQHAIEVPGRDYEIGLVPYQDHWKVAWDNWHGEVNLGPLVQAYACEKAKMEAAQQGMACQEEVLRDGTIRLRIMAS